MKKRSILLLIASCWLASTCFAYTYRGTASLTGWLPPKGINAPEIKSLTVKWMVSDKGDEPEQAFNMQWYLGDHYVYDYEKINLRQLRVDRSMISLVTLVLRAEVHSNGQYVADLEFDMGATPPHGGIWGAEVGYAQAMERFFWTPGADTYLTAEAAQQLFDEEISLQNLQIVEIAFGGLDEIERGLGKARSQEGYLSAIESGDAALQNKQYEIALQQYESALELRPDDAAAVKRIKQVRYVLLIAKGDSAFDNKDFVNARLAYEAADQVQPGESAPQERIRLIEQMQARAGKVDETAVQLRSKYAQEAKQAKEAQSKAVEMASLAFSETSETCNFEWLDYYECAAKHWERKESEAEIEAKALLLGDESARAQTTYSMPCSEPTCKRFDDAANTFGVTADDYLAVAKRKYAYFTDQGYENFREQALAYTSRAIEADYQHLAAYLFRATIQENVMDRVGDVEMALSINPDSPEGVALKAKFEEDFLKQLHEKIEAGDIKYIREAKQKNLIDPEATHEGKTALERAVEHEQIDIIKELTAQEGSPRGRMIPIEQQLLFTAARQNKAKVAAYLIEKGARADYTNEKGESPLSIAAAENASDVISVLVGRTGTNLSEDASGSVRVAVERGNYELAETFLEKGSNVESITPAGESLLMTAVRAGQLRISELLIWKGANPDHSNQQNETPLSVAASLGHIQICNLLLHEGADDARNLDFLLQTDSTAAEFLAERTLFLAMEQGDPERASRAIRAVPGLANREVTGGLSLLEIALQKKQHAIAAVLVPHTLFTSPADTRELFLQAVEAASIPTVQAMVATHGADLTSDVFQEVSPLHIAVRAGDPEMVQTLLSESFPPDPADKYGNTPLHIALTLKQDDLAMTLVRMQANVKAANNRGIQPIHIAARMVNLEMVKNLLSAGADIDAVGESGMTSLHIAVEEGNYELVSFLVKAKANKHLIDHFDRTPRQIAQQRGDKPMSRLLK